MQARPVIPGYELWQWLGGGPMTSVFAARDEAGGDCALKTLRPDWPDPSTGIKLLQREARAGLSVRHPNLVQFLDVHVLREPHYLVMELLPGESLRNRLQRDDRLDVGSSLWIARQVAEALAALHRVGFVHGDVKPENIWLVAMGTSKLIDLGFAHRPGENAELVQQGYMLGTANYLAPEVCSLPAEPQKSSDLFSLGVTLFEMLTGRLPYPVGTVRQTLHRHRCDPPADLLPYSPDVQPALAKIVDALLEHRAEDRPRASAVVQKLRALEVVPHRGRLSA